jgi:hypothetical protein
MRLELEKELLAGVDEVPGGSVEKGVMVPGSDEA